MTKCPNCGHENRAGELVCVECNTNLATGEKTSSTKQLDDDSKQKVSDLYGEDVLKDTTSPIASFPENGILRLEIVGSPLPIQVKFTKSEIILGRRDPATGSLPDVDLAPFAGYRMGVSRRHSQIKRAEDGNLELFDLGSSNGTFLNGQRLAPHTPYRLNDRDRMALGQINLQVIFRPDVEGTISTRTQIAPDAPTRPSITDAANESERAARPTTNKISDRPDRPNTSMLRDLGQVLGDASSTVVDNKGVGEKKSEEIKADKPVEQKKPILPEIDESSAPLAGTATQRNIENIMLSVDERMKLFSSQNEAESIPSSDETKKDAEDKPSSDSKSTPGTASEDKKSE